MVSYFYIHVHPLFVHPPTGSGGLNLTYKHLFQFWSHVLRGAFSLGKHSQREGYQADVLVQPSCWWVQTQLGFAVLTNRTVGFIWIWAGYSAAGSNLQDLFFYCKWLCLFYRNQLLYLFFGGEGGCSCHPHTLPAAMPIPRASSPFAATTEWSLYRHFPTCWHLFTWVWANCTLSYFSRWLFRV